MAVDHYENFPVASILLPKHLRPAVHAIYAFARSADDIADEGDAGPDERIAGLRRYEEDLDRIADGQTASHPILLNLTGTIHRHDLPLQPFRDLLSAFTQDVTTKRYDNFDALRDYCSRSADPVGTLMLHLYGAATRENLVASDCICTALQLINFLQDVAIDWVKERIYIPLEDIRRFGVSEQHIADAVVDARWQALMRFEVERSRALMLTGAPLACRLPGRIGWELRLIVQGGLRILNRIEAADYDVFRQRPVLGPRDWLAVGRQALVMRLARH
jgi:squalene synthase HpnC